jgi:hypothetical protein
VQSQKAAIVVDINVFHVVLLNLFDFLIAGKQFVMPYLSAETSIYFLSKSEFII